MTDAQAMTAIEAGNTNYRRHIGPSSRFSKAGLVGLALSFSPGIKQVQKMTGMEAVRDRMPMARLARELGLTRGAVAQWKKVPAERMADVSRITGISIELLRPDIFRVQEAAQ